MEGGPIVVNQEADQELLNLPPGFRFHPTDEEIIAHYLTQKVINPNFTATAMGEVDLNKSEPWDLPDKAKMGEKEWFFFCQRDRKYPTGMRTNRATESGYWKATGKDKEIYRKPKTHAGGQQQLVGMKKTLVFYKGRAPKGEKSNWVMHEYRLDGKLSYHNFPNKSAPKDEWVVCKIFHKNATMMNKKNSMTDLFRINSFVEGMLDSPNSMPPLMDSPYANINTSHDQGTIFPNQMHTYVTNNPNTISQTNNYNNYDDRIPNSVFYSQNANYPYQASTSLGNYLHQQRFNSVLPPERQCKMEQYSSNVSRSQDTGLSTDLTAEISSKQKVDGSKHAYNQDHIEDNQLTDMDSFWNFQV